MCPAPPRACVLGAQGGCLNGLSFHGYLCQLRMARVSETCVKKRKARQEFADTVIHLIANLIYLAQDLFRKKGHEVARIHEQYF